MFKYLDSQKMCFSQIIKMSHQNVITSVFIIFTTTVVDDDLDFDNFNIILWVQWSSF